MDRKKGAFSHRLSLTFQDLGKFYGSPLANGTHFGKGTCGSGYLR